MRRASRPAPWTPRSWRPGTGCASGRSQYTRGRRACRHPVPTPGTDAPMPGSPSRPATSASWPACSSRRCRSPALHGSRGGPGAPWNHRRWTPRSTHRTSRSMAPTSDRRRRRSCWPITGFGSRRRRQRWPSSRGATSTRSSPTAIRRRCASIGRSFLRWCPCASASRFRSRTGPSPARSTRAGRCGSRCRTRPTRPSTRSTRSSTAHASSSTRRRRSGGRRIGSPSGT